MTPVLEHGGNFLVFPFYSDVLDRRKPLPFRMIRRTREIIRHFRARGYELIDFKPKNILLDASEGMKIIDFEFLQPGGAGTEALAGNYCWYSIPGDFPGDVPSGTKRGRNNYYRHWFTAAALPLFFAARNFPAPVLAAARLPCLAVIRLYRLARRMEALLPEIEMRVKNLIIGVLKKIL
jgi:hypothetical protein